MPAFQWGVFLADLNPTLGSEQRGTRPVLVVSSELFNQILPAITVLPLTSTKRRIYPAEVPLPVGAAGQPQESIILAHQIRTIDKRRLQHCYGYLVDASLRLAVQDALKLRLDLP